jgi:hypothetical protein
MSEIVEKKVSLKRFLALSEKYDHYDRYIRLYYFEDENKVRRLIALTHQEHHVKNPVDKDNDIRITVSYFCEIPIAHLSVHDSNIDGKKQSHFGERPLKLFHLHHDDAWNFISVLKLLDVTKADKMVIDYYPHNNSTNNLEKGLFQESMKFCLLKATKKGSVETYRVSVNNQFVDECCRLIDYHGLGDGFRLFDALTLLKKPLTED